MLKRTFVLAGILTMVSSQVLAVETIYRNVFFESETTFDPNSHRETLFAGNEVVALDLDAQTAEFRAFDEVSTTRTLNFFDQTAAGSQVVSQPDSGTDDCDDGGLPCPEDISVSGSYLVFGEGLEASRGVLSPGNEFMAVADAESTRFALSRQSAIGLSLLIDRPSSLTLASLNGTYRIFRYQSSMLAQSGGFTEEIMDIDDVDITFNGAGSCTGSVLFSEAFQGTSWTDTSTRNNVTIARDNAVNFQSCSYTVDSGAGTMTLDVSVLDDGEVDSVSFDFFVSSTGRYLTGNYDVTDVDGDETEYDVGTWIGIRTGSTLSNTSVQGVYLFSSWGQAFINGTRGSDSDFASRSGVEFSGAAPDGSGYSACSILGQQGAAVTRALDGIAPDVDANIDYDTDLGLPAYNTCRYRASGNTLEVGFSADGSSFDTTTYQVTDDLATLTSGSLTTSQSSFPAGQDIPLTAPGFASASLIIGQKINASATDANVLDFLTPLIPQADPDITLTSSVLPLSRSVQVGNTATAFASLINLGTVDALNCDILPDTDFDGQFFYQTTNPATNAPVGNMNEPINIAAGATQTFYFGITPQSPIDPTDFELTFECVNATAAGSFVGLNTLLLSASSSPVADIVALGATATNDGIVHLANDTLAGAFSVATVNVGSLSNLTVSIDTGSATLPIATSICQTDPGTGACINPTTPAAQVTLDIAANETPTFAVFVASSEAIALDPAGKRVFVRFTDGGGVARGATSVAIQSD